MARQLLRDTCETARAIMDGGLDGDLTWIEQAAQARRKNLYRKGARVRLTGTRNRAIEGMEGTILRVNQKTVAVGCGEKDEFGFYRSGEFNVPPVMLELL